METGNHKVSRCQDSMEYTRELTENINKFPITNQPLSNSTLKDMLVSVRSTLHADMMESMQTSKSDMGELGGRMDHGGPDTAYGCSHWYTILLGPRPNLSFLEGPCVLSKSPLLEA